MCPATLPITLRLMEASRLSSSEFPATTSRAPKKMIPPTMTVLRRLASRLRKAICATTPKVSSQAFTLFSSGANGSSHVDARFLRGHAIDQLAVRQADHRAGVGHHAVVVGREDEGGPLGAVELLHEVQDVL